MNLIEASAYLMLVDEKFITQIHFQFTRVNKWVVKLYASVCNVCIFMYVRIARSMLYIFHMYNSHHYSHLDIIPYLGLFKVILFCLFYWLSELKVVIPQLVKSVHAGEKFSVPLTALYPEKVCNEFNFCSKLPLHLYTC